MAAQLDLINLRRHALPAHFMAAATRPAKVFDVSGRLLDLAPRPRLLATWRLDAGGRPACAWTLDTNDPRLMPA